MATSYSRGWEIHFVDDCWRYKDSGKVCDWNRPCKRCGKRPTADGHDACLGELENVSSACCGHGVSNPIMMEQKENL